jgi:hypothetical protein
MMEAIHFSETSVLTRATGRHIPEDGILRKSLKSYKESRLNAVLVKSGACWKGSNFKV